MSIVDAALGLEPEPEDLPEPSANGQGPHFDFTDLGESMKRGLREPRRLEGLLYPGKLHSLAGPPESGKTVLALWLAWLVMQRGGQVLYVDEEAGADSMTSILLGFGADPALISERLDYLPFPNRRWHDGDILGLHEALEARRPSLAIWDSMAALMAIADQDENNARDVTRMWTRLFMPMARHLGCAVLVTDHDSKTSTDSRYARGSGAKLANVDVMLKLQALRPFSRMQDGLLSLEITKDRHGWLHRHWHVRVGHDPLALKLGKSAPPLLAGMGLPPGAEALAKTLTPEPVPVRTLIDRLVERGEIPLRRPTASTYLNMLLERGMCDRIDQGPGRDALWSLPTEPES